MYKSFKDMPIWQEALDIAEKIGKRVEYFDKDLVGRLNRRLLKLYNDLNKIVVILKSSEK